MRLHRYIWHDVTHPYTTRPIHAWRDVPHVWIVCGYVAAYICDVTHSYTTRPIHMWRDVPHKWIVRCNVASCHTSNDAFVYDTTHSCVTWRASHLDCVWLCSLMHTWRDSCVSDTTHSCVTCCASHMDVELWCSLMPLYDVTHSYTTRPMHVWRDVPQIWILNCNVASCLHDVSHLYTTRPIHVWRDVPHMDCGYGVALASRLLKIIGLFCRISSLL